MLPMHYKVLLQISPEAASQVELLTKVIDLILNKLQSDTHRRPAQELFVFETDLCMASIHSRAPLLLSRLGM